MKYTLYQIQHVPFANGFWHIWVQTGREVPQKDTLLDFEAYRELIRDGGRGMVPCLRIESDDGHVRWMYESQDIIEYLDRAL